MDLNAVSHRCMLPDCYAVNDEELVIRIYTGKEVRAVSLVHEDPFADGCMGMKPWHGKAEPMQPTLELARSRVWSIRLQPKYKREQYYFSLYDGAEMVLLFEDGFYSPIEAAKPGRILQYFKFPWLNPSDVCRPPEWVKDMVWYQIMPDRFCKGGTMEKRMVLRGWNTPGDIGYQDFFGGDLPGIISKLDYLKSLGVTGIYMTPVFLSDSNHRYNTFDYDQIDPDVGTEQDLRDLVEQAHARGIRVMVDAVFNHCGAEFAPWRDVLKNGKNSPYYDWFFVNQEPLEDSSANTEDGRYYTFAFEAYMPKLNTNHPDVMDYCIQRCRHWITDWGVDGIRFDVGNEVSHIFLKKLRRELKQISPDVFLLGEIWSDALPWLQGDEYDSVMNYPFFESIHNFWLDQASTANDLMYAVNRCRVLYPEQVERVLFNFLDTHDTPRAINRCGNLDVFFQQLTLLMTMPGSPCIYYGTEIAMDGKDDPNNRRPMPWDQIERGDHDAVMRIVKALIHLRHSHPQLRSGMVKWEHSTASRLICYRRLAEDRNTAICIFLNAETKAVSVHADCILFQWKYSGDLLRGGGILILEETNLGKEVSDL